MQTATKLMGLGVSGEPARESGRPLTARCRTLSPLRRAPLLSRVDSQYGPEYSR